jgi:hypothetical protein
VGARNAAELRQDQGRDAEAWYDHLKETRNCSSPCDSS